MKTIIRALRVFLLGSLLALNTSQQLLAVSIDDDFNDNFLNPNLWSVTIDPPNVGTISETNQRIEMTHLNPGQSYLGLASKCIVSGDFDVQVDFKLLNWSPQNFHTVRFAAQDLTPALFGHVGIYRNSYNDENYQFRADNVVQITTTDVAGTLRLVRIGSTIFGYVWNGNQFVLIGTATTSINDTRFILDTSTPEATAVGNISIVFDNFKVNAGAVACPPTITAVAPSTGIQGQTIDIFTVFGNDFQPTATLSFSGTGIAVNSYSLRTPTQIVANITVGNNAPLATLNVIISNVAASQTTLGGAFTIVQASSTTQAGGPLAPFVNVLAIDPASPNTLYAGTEGAGILKSTNGGQSWTIANAGLRDGFVRALVLAFRYGGVLHCAVERMPDEILLGYVSWPLFPACKSQPVC